MISENVKQNCLTTHDKLFFMMRETREG